MLVLGIGKVVRNAGATHVTLSAVPHLIPSRQILSQTRRGKPQTHFCDGPRDTDYKSTHYGNPADRLDLPEVNTSYSVGLSIKAAFKLSAILQRLRSHFQLWVIGASGKTSKG
jgi:hypothetical protein